MLREGRDARISSLADLTSKWFLLDTFSILTSLFDIVEFEGAKSLTALRAVRVLRLAKLVRLMRGSRIFKTWEMRMSIDYAMLSLAQTIAMLIVGCHWFACTWGLQASFDPLGSWPGGKGYCIAYSGVDREPAVQENDTAQGVLDSFWSADDPSACPDGWRCDAESGVACVGAWKMYSYSLYFSIMTITSGARAGPHGEMYPAVTPHPCGHSSPPRGHFLAPWFSS